MKTTNRTVSYFSLMSRFWALDELQSFSPVATKLYFLLLHNANKNRWPNKFPYSDTRAAASVGVSVAKIKTARQQLADAGLICVTPGGKGHAQKTLYSLTGCDHCDYHNSAECITHCPESDQKQGANVGSSKSIPNLTPKQDESEQGVKVDSNVGGNLGCNSELPKSAPLLIRQDHTKKNTLPQKEEKEEIFDLDKLEAPQDGVKRNFNGLRERLKSIGATPGDSKKIIILSNYGQIGHPIWGALAELRNCVPGAIKSPVRFIFSRISESSLNPQNI